MNISHDLSVHNLLKKLNTMKSIKEFAKELTKGIVNSFPVNACWFCLLNPETNKLGVKRFAYAKDMSKNPQMHEIIERIFLVGKDFLTNLYDMDDTLDYFNSVSKDNVILEPVIYRNNLMGYLTVIGKDKQFNSQYTDIIGIIAENINTKLEVLFLYDELERNNQNRINFLAGISHEYKTPLNSIIGFSDLLKAKHEGTESYRYADVIAKSSKFLLALIQDVLDLSRCGANLLELKYETFMPRKIIEDIVYSFKEQAKEKNVEINYTLTDVSIYADLKRFKQLVFNFISNAVKFNKENGKVMIVTYIDEDGNFVLEVKDQGEGISKKDYGKIFGFFNQVSKSHFKREQGSGIGLALCKEIIERHKGKIGFKSKLNQGSTFWFSIPK